jgi:hypothetical protein
MSGLTPAFESSEPNDLPAVPSPRTIAPARSAPLGPSACPPGELFELTCEQAAIGIAHLSIDEKWLWVNQRFCDIVGWPREAWPFRPRQSRAPHRRQYSASTACPVVPHDRHASDVSAVPPAAACVAPGVPPRTVCASSTVTIPVGTARMP